MFRQIAALAFSGVLAVTSLAPTQTRAADADDIAKLVLGALVIYGISEGIRDNRTPSQPQVVTKKPTRTPHYKFPDTARSVLPHRPEVRYLPRYCFLTHQVSHRETRKVLGIQCLQRNYRAYAHLPQQCYRRFHTVKGPRVGWAPRCLRRAGYTW